MSGGGHFIFHHKSAVLGRLNEEERSDAGRKRVGVSKFMFFFPPWTGLAGEGGEGVKKTHRKLIED